MTTTQNGMELCYASLAFPANIPVQKIPPQLRNHHNTDKSLWSARRDKVWSTGQEKVKRTNTGEDDEEPLGTLPPARALPPAPRLQHLDRQVQTELIKGQNKKLWLMIILASFVCFATISNIVIWIVVVSTKPQCEESHGLVTLPFSGSTTTQPPRCDPIYLATLKQVVRCQTFDKVPESDSIYLDLGSTYYICTVQLTFKGFGGYIYVTVSVDFYDGKANTISNHGECDRSTDFGMMINRGPNNDAIYRCDSKGVNSVTVKLTRQHIEYLCTIQISGEIQDKK